MEKVITILENRPYIAKLGRNQFPKVYREVKLNSEYNCNVIFSASHTWIERSKKRAFTRHNKDAFNHSSVTLKMYISFVKDDIKYLFQPWCVCNIDNVDEYIKNKVTTEKFAKNVDNLITEILADKNTVEYC